MRARITSAGKFWLVFNLVISIVVSGSLVQAAEIDPLGEVGSKRSGSTWRFSSVEQCFMHRINNKRAALGRRRLYWDKQLGYVARRHAQRLAGARAVAHDYNMGDEITRWYRLGQNTGGGQSCRSLTRSFLNSSKHRANILGRWRHVGVGASWSGGRLYVQQIFESRRNPGNIYSYP